MKPLLAVIIVAWGLTPLIAAETRLNNLVSELLAVNSVAAGDAPLAFSRPAAGWVLVSGAHQGRGTLNIELDPDQDVRSIIACDTNEPGVAEGMRYVAAGEHHLRVHCTGEARVERLIVRAIPELMHCGLGFDPAIKSYGRYDLEFLSRDILPNVTTLIVPHSIQLPAAAIDDWHGRGKRFVAEVGINGQAQTADEHVRYWTELIDKAPFLDGILINEFIVNNPSTRDGRPLSAERQARMEQERKRHRMFEEAFRKLHAAPRFARRTVDAYVGGSGKKLNQEMIGPTFVRTLLDCGVRIALERYLFEVSSEHASQNALQTFVDGIADWEAREPGIKRQMIVAFGLFSMPPGGINKLPNVDYHVWMDQQMHTVANCPQLAGLGGLNWWTSLQADEETVRFVGKLYRHYAIEGRTDLLTKDPLFLSHIENADFEHGLAGWAIEPAVPGTIAPKSFPRFGRIEGRYMGLDRPADPEHIGDTFLWMQRSSQGPNKFSQTIKNLEPGRLYSLKMFSCDYQDLIEPRAKKLEDATPFVGSVTIEGVEVDEGRSFAEPYASNPEPKIPVWITYHWKVFRALKPTARLTVADWPSQPMDNPAFGQQQVFNFLEIQPYHE